MKIVEVKVVFVPSIGEYRVEITEEIPSRFSKKKRPTLVASFWSETKPTVIDKTKNIKSK